jgi:glycosyltransferase involved in cell wall biosynthesis
VRALFNTYPVAFACPGGGEIQLLRCQAALAALGVDVTLFDPWRPQFDVVDVVHYFSVQGGSMNFCDFVKRTGLPLLISPILWLTPQNRGQFPLSEIRDLLHLCDRVLPNSQAECEQLSDVFDIDPAKFTVVPNGVDPQFGVPANPQDFRRKFDLASRFLLNVANIEPRKNQRLLARVARRMDLDLVLLGHVRDQDYLRDCLDEGGPRVRHVGYLDHDDPLLKSAYRACEVFVLPSLLETPGLAALEAAAQGARVVITSEGATREYFRKMADYVDATSADSLCQAIENQWAARPSDELRRYVLDNFTWLHAGKALVDAYQRTLLATSSVC